MVAWHIVNQEAMQQKEVAEGKEPHNYITDVKYAVKDYSTGTITMAKEGKQHNYEQDLVQILESNQALKENKELRTKVMKEAKNLVSYFTKSTDAEDNDLGKNNARFKDGKMDKGEFEAAINDINTKFEDRGVALNISDNANFIAQNKPADAPMR